MLQILDLFFLILRIYYLEIWKIIPFGFLAIIFYITGSINL